MSELIGRNLGPYRIIQQLGMGGMATVYKAYQANMDRYVAVKVLPRHFAQDPTFVGRFEQEAKVIAKLEHARILPVYDYGEDDGTTYIVMRYLDAGTLSERIRGGKIPLPETARIIGQVGEGLDYAHKKGVIHRDVKPSNIMLDSNGDIYITDFGISKLIEGTAQFTGSGIVGTPDYVSPEQALGQPIDHRSDIYSLGIVLYQMATNDVPFHAETPMAVIIKHIHDPLPLPRSLNPDIPDSVQNVILKALAKNPDDRYQACADLSKALSAAVGGEPIVAPVVSPAEIATAIPQATKAMPAEAGTIPMPGPSAASAETQLAAKKRPRWVVPVAIIGGLVLLSVLALIVLGALRNARERRAAAAATASQQVAGNPATTGALQGSVPPPSGTQSVSPVFEDRFDSTSLNPAWQWLNEPQGKWALSGGQLTIAVLPGTAVVTGSGPSYQPGGPALVLSVPARAATGGRFSFQASVTVAPKADVQGAGLIVLSERKQPLFTLARASCSQPAPTCSGDALYLDDWRAFAMGITGYHARQVEGGQLPIGGTLFLRMNVQPGRVGGEYSLDGHQWNPVGDWPLAADTRVGFIGLETASGGQTPPAVPARFRNFLVTLLPPPPA